MAPAAKPTARPTTPVEPMHAHPIEPVSSAMPEADNQNQTPARRRLATPAIATPATMPPSEHAGTQSDEQLPAPQP